MSGNVQSEVSRAIIKLMMDEPFFGNYLGQLTRVFTERVPTAAVGLQNKTLTLFVNPDFFLNELKTTEERIAILKHEVLHLVFFHLFRFQGEKTENNAYINNLAADLVVNQYVDPWPLPEGAVTLDKFWALDLEPEQTVEYYYEKLIQAKEEADQNIEDLESELNDLGEEDEGKGLEEAIENWKWTKDVLDEKEGTGVWMDDHSTWSDEPVDEVTRQQVENLAKKTKKSLRPEDWRSAPGFLEDLLDEMEARRKPKVDWKRTLRLFANNSRRSKVVATRKRYSKRYGKPSPGIRIKKFQSVVVIVDTSGSMVAEEVVSALFSEIRGIWKTGAQVHIVECDTVVHRTYDYKGTNPTFVEGGGGNDCDPAFEYLWEYRRKKGPVDGCIFMTEVDGWRKSPQKPMNGRGHLREL